MSEAEVESRWEAARELCRAAGLVAVGQFDRRDFTIEEKPDASPVTEADRAAELLLRERLAERFPGDGVLGEEFGETGGSSEFRWILDPIDGTKSFICGVPLFGTMVAVERAGVAWIGAVYFPALDEMVTAARGRGAWHQRRGEAVKRCRVSEQATLANSVVVTSDVGTFSRRGAETAWSHLQTACRFARTWGDAYGYCLVATGRAEVMIDPVLSVWDAAAVMPIVEEAGGRFTDWRGQPKIDAGDAVGSNGLIHAEVLALLQAK